MIRERRSSRHGRGRPGRKALLAATVAAMLMSYAPGASAYCRTSVCGDFPGTRCVPAQPADCGTVVFWASECVGYSLQEDGAPGFAFAPIDAALDASAAVWSEPHCDGVAPSVALENLGPVACDAHEYNTSGGNANVIVFNAGPWPYGGALNALALTTITYNLETGEIYDADMEINAESTVYTLDLEAPEIDLPSILTHEFGHFLGLSHSSAASATMRPAYKPGQTELRSLEGDDQKAICAAYPPGQSRTCDPQPRHGLQSECRAPASPDIMAPDDSAESGCSLANPTAAPAWRAIGMAALGLTILRARRRR